MRVHFLLKIIEKLILQLYHYGAVACAINLILWSGTRHWKKAPTFNWSIKGFEIFWWCWTSFPTWRVSSLFNLQHVHRKLKQTLATCSQHRARVCFCLLWIYWRSNKLETCQVLLPLFCLKKYQFWFLLMLRTYSAEVCQK